MIRNMLPNDNDDYAAKQKSFFNFLLGVLCVEC